MREAALEKFQRTPENDVDDGAPRSWTVVDYGKFNAKAVLRLWSAGWSTRLQERSMFAVWDASCTLDGRSI